MRKPNGTRSAAGRCSCSARRGAAAVELAILSPLLVFLGVAAVDFGRVFYDASIVANCARNGALYASDPLAASISSYSSLQAAALADATNLSPTPTVSSTTGTDSSGNSYVEVSVSYTFKTIFTYPGVPKTTVVVRKVRMGVSQVTPS